jgi:hypothetical protein
MSAGTGVAEITTRQDRERSPAISMRYREMITFSGNRAIRKEVNP